MSSKVTIAEIARLYVLAEEAGFHDRPPEWAGLVRKLLRSYNAQPLRAAVREGVGMSAKRVKSTDTKGRLAAIRRVLKRRSAHPEDDDEALLLMIIDGERSISSTEPFPEPIPVQRKRKSTP